MTLNRPPRRNALNAELSDALLLAAKEVAAATDLRAILLSGVDPVFCAGTDLTEGASMTAEQFVDHERRYIALRNAIADLPVPVVAQIRGGAYGGGFFLASYADFRVVQADSVLAAPEVSHGWLPPGGCDELIEIVGAQRAREILMTSAPMSGEEAGRIGWADRVAPLAQVDAVTDALIEQLTAVPPRGVASVKRLLHERARDRRAALDELQLREFSVALSDDAARRALARFSRPTANGGRR